MSPEPNLKNTAIPNDVNISCISFTMRVHSYCTIGKDYFTNNIKVEFVPGDIIPDYTEVQNRIKALEGQVNNVEAVVAKVFDIMDEVSPTQLRVSSHVDDAETHFPVTVTKIK